VLNHRKGDYAVSSLPETVGHASTLGRAEEASGRSPRKRVHRSTPFK
jgi:hypothetical protein